ncbi:DMT family transporter [Clostridium sp.]|uniref:DMT family transporter n=1 Tax=Clostridium sp. TaxID=1506 RepID=UPI002FDE20E3
MFSYVKTSRYHIYKGVIIISQRKADLIIALITIAWGSSYLFMKMGLDSIDVFNLVALRFGIAFLLTAPIFYKKLCNIDKKTLLYGGILGAALFCVLSTLMFGLKTTSASSAGFLAGTTVIFVPLLQIIIHGKKPTLPITAGVFLTIIGIGLLTIDITFQLDKKSLLCVLAAFIYAGQILLTSYFSKMVDPLALGVLQLGFAGIFGLLFSFIFEQPRLPANSVEWLAVLSLSVVCSAFGFILQPVAQKYTTPERTGILFSLEPVFSAIFGFIFLHEVLKVQGYLGAILVFSGVIISGINKKRCVLKSITKEK